ncbi:hypothetical protein G6F57_020517 [Rhizopus arrhizus]|nr:hypothetical protein G6F57_020517 [Rhizopus arrhizus]
MPGQRQSAGRTGGRRLCRPDGRRHGPGTLADAGLRQHAGAVRQAHRPLPGRAAADQCDGRTGLGRPHGRAVGVPRYRRAATGDAGRDGQGARQLGCAYRRRHRARGAWRHRRHRGIRLAAVHPAAARVAAGRRVGILLARTHRRPCAGQRRGCADLPAHRIIHGNHSPGPPSWTSAI